MIEIKSEFTGSGVETSIKLSGDRSETLMEIAGVLIAIHKKLNEIQLDGDTEKMLDEMARATGEEATICS